LEKKRKEKKRIDSRDKSGRREENNKESNLLDELSSEDTNDMVKKFV
jgi:hypothetical protein